ncbi:hypothetical protein N0V88_007800 [Collariella sp. IMI 366227]|nr:hypothetical protein N0V88_007800 [Collariella sp. IMI 366227]
MSPCETLTLGNKQTPNDTLPVSLEDYAVTSNGFLPADAPLARLTNPYHAPWETLMDSLPELVANRTLRQLVDNLPVLSTDILATEAEWRRACVVLGFLTHAYVWGGETAAEFFVDPPTPITIPSSPSPPTSASPVATYACVNLWNFRSASPTANFTDLDALTSLQTFTGTLDESWFYVVSVAMEAQGAYIIPLMLSALEATFSPSTSSPSTTTSTTVTATPTIGYHLITTALHSLTTCIHSLGLLLDRMDTHCRPPVFYHAIRPFLAGSKNMASAGLPRGVFYDEGEGKGSWRQLRGGSNGQNGDEGAGEFRNKHLQMVARYIIVPSRQPNPNTG